MTDRKILTISNFDIDELRKKEATRRSISLLQNKIPIMDQEDTLRAIKTIDCLRNNKAYE